MKSFLLAVSVLFAGCLAAIDNNYEDLRNLLVNPEFDFHSYVNHRDGKAISFVARNAAGWNTDGPADVAYMRESHIPQEILSPLSVRNGVKIEAGKRIYQFFTLPEARLVPGNRISLSFWGTPGIKASIKQLKFDSETGTWSPGEFGFADKRTFPKHSRGELVVATQNSLTVELPEGKPFATKLYAIESVLIDGDFSDKNESNSEHTYLAGIEIEFANVTDHDTWLFAPGLIKSPNSIQPVGKLRETPTVYRHIPRTIQKLWKGEPIHIIVMGSSIDRASANPPLYPYNEDPASPDFKKPLCDAYDGKFSASMLGRPDLDDYLAQPRHYFSYGGRLKRELMIKFNLPADKILINFMAADGSCIGESHSGLKAYCDLAIAPNPELNGHKTGKTWQELYPALFARPEGPRPDLIIYGSGANEKTDTPNEVAVFEGAIRYIQRNYPGTEFLFCQFQQRGVYTPNPGDLQALALRYQIPFIDYGMVSDLMNRTSSNFANVPADGHPQAAAHYIWFKQIEQAFECHDPIVTGQAQLQLPERVHPNTYGWEGEMAPYREDSPRLFRPGAFILDDAAFNCWGSYTGKACAFQINGKNIGSPRTPLARIDLRNSLFRFGNQSIGDRYVLEMKAENPKFTGVDSKICPNRQFICVSSPLWSGNDLKPQKYESKTGYPYGTQTITLAAGESTEISAIGTDFSVVWVDAANSGKLKAELDGKEAFTVSAAEPYKFTDDSTMFMENRKGILNRPYGVHNLKLTAIDGPVQVMGLYTYDARSNRANERVIRGYATPGATVQFNPPFKAIPLVNANYPIEQIDAAGLKFGQGTGFYEIIGE